MLGDEATVHGAEEVKVGDLGPGQRVKCEAPGASTQQVRPPSPELPRAGPAQHETQVVALDESVHLVEDGGHLLHFVDDDWPLPPGPPECPNSLAQGPGRASQFE